MRRAPSVLSIHASDNSGEEGILADAEVCRDLDCEPKSVVSSILCGGADRIDALQPVSLATVGQQLESLLSHHSPAACRIGILPEPSQVELVAEILREYRVPNVVLTPVVRIAGTPILTDDTLARLRGSLFPLARVVVVRAADTRHLCDVTAEDVTGLIGAAERLRRRGTRSALVAGLTRRGRVLDVLDDEGRVGVLDVSRVAAPRIPGLTGAHAAAVACGLAKGAGLKEAAVAAQRYVVSRLSRGR